MFEEAFVQESPDDGDVHRLPFRVKMSSVAQPKTRAKFNAKGRLGTYRSPSMELMLWRDTPTASASCCCVHPRAVRSSLMRLTSIWVMSSRLYIPMIASMFADV